MPSPSPLPSPSIAPHRAHLSVTQRIADALQRRLYAAGRWLHTLAWLLATMATPSCYTAKARQAIAHRLWYDTWLCLPGFALLTTLSSLVLLRISTTTAQRYGLATFAVETIVRVVVQELIPLLAALFVALRCAPSARHTAALRSQRTAADIWRHGLLPHAIGVIGATLVLVVVASALVLSLAYIDVYGLSPWGFAEFTRLIGALFDLPTSLGLALRTAFFSLAVASLPLSANTDAGLTPLFLLLLALEAASLTLRYV